MRKQWIILSVMVIAAMVLSACGGSAPAASNSAPAAAQPAQANTNAAAPAATEASMQMQSTEMQHSSDPMSDNSYDVHFIDSTLEHHAGVLAMAHEALTQGQNVALKDLAQQIMTNTQKEIDWLNAYRQKNHPNAPVMKDDMSNMGSMGISTDASNPFEKRFAEAMISHHQGMISMAKEALAKLGHDDLKQFAQTLASGEEAEVAQLQQFVK